MYPRGYETTLCIRLYQVCLLWLYCCVLWVSACPANTGHSPNAVSVLAHRFRRLKQHSVPAGICYKFKAVLSCVWSLLIHVLYKNNAVLGKFVFFDDFCILSSEMNLPIRVCKCHYIFHFPKQCLFCVSFSIVGFEFISSFVGLLGTLLDEAIHL